MEVCQVTPNIHQTYVLKAAPPQMGKAKNVFPVPDRGSHCTNTVAKLSHMLTLGIVHVHALEQFDH